MKIVAALPWYDESVAFLDRCVRSLEGVADELVAIDGRWDLYDPEAPVLSHWTQAQAIGNAADSIRLEHHIFLGARVWESQVAKRQALMELAGERGDWVLVIDADEYISDSAPIAVREVLAWTKCDVATVSCTTLNGDRPQAKIRRLFRSGTTISKAHNGYLYEGRWLHGDSARVRLEEAEDVAALLELHDATGMRSPDRNSQAQAYRLRRARHRVEVWA